MSRYGQALRELRERGNGVRPWTYGQLANRSGVARWRLWAAEHGEARLSIEETRAVCAALRCDGEAKRVLSASLREVLALAGYDPGERGRAEIDALADVLLWDPSEDPWRLRATQGEGGRR